MGAELSGGGTRSRAYRHASGGAATEYSASTGESFFTGASVHHFENFEDW
jgi:hypothetical protein